MFIHGFSCGPFATNVYIIACEETQEAAIIDAAPESLASIDYILQGRKFTPTKILLTHSHWDHIADIVKIKEKYNIPVFIHEKDQDNLENPGKDGISSWVDTPGVKPDGHFVEGDIIAIGNIKLEVIETPGHTPGGVCFYCKEHHTLISGDTLFQGSIGNLSLPTANPEDMWRSLDKLAKLPPETKVYPGHGPETTIGNESWLPQAKKIFEEYI